MDLDLYTILGLRQRANSGAGLDSLLQSGGNRLGVQAIQLKVLNNCHLWDRHRRMVTLGVIKHPFCQAVSWPDLGIQAFPISVT